MKNRIFRILTVSLMTVCLAACTFGCGSKDDYVDEYYDDDEDEYIDEYADEDYYDDSSYEDDSQEDQEEYYAEEAEEEDQGSGYFDYEATDMGIVFHLPEEILLIKGSLDFSSKDVADGEGIFYSVMDYFGVDAQAYENDGITDEESNDYNRKTVPLFIIMGAADNKPVSEIIEYVNADTGKKYEESNLSLIKEVNGFNFYRYVPDVPENYNNLDGDFVSEYDTLAGLSDGIINGADYSRPLSKYESMVGNSISFTTTDLDGNPVTSDEIFSKNDITMVNVWATWCGWCCEELPELEKINDRLSSQNCAIVGLCGDAYDASAIAEAKSLLSDSGVTYTNILPYDGWDEDFEVEGWPTSFFVDKTGKMVAAPIVGAKVDQYESYISDALNGKTAQAVPETNSYKNSENAYRVMVMDNNSNPVEGAMVQFCSDETCRMGKTDSTGTAVFDAPEGIYDVHVRKVPDGYRENDTAYKTESFYSDMVIVVEKN